MNKPRLFSTVRRAGITLIGIVALVAVALPSAAFAAAGPAVVEASYDGIHYESGKFNRHKPTKKVYGYSYSKATKNYEKKYGDKKPVVKKVAVKKHDTQKAACQAIYKVKKGDNLTRIAKRFHVS